MTDVALSSAIVWGIVLAIAVGTVLSRVSFIVLFGWIDSIPRWLKRLLALVPPAALAALVAPSLLVVDDAITVTNPRLPAGLAAAVVAWRTGNLLATVVVGMVVFWLGTVLLASL